MGNLDDGKWSWFIVVCDMFKVSGSKFGVLGMRKDIDDSW